MTQDKQWYEDWVWEEVFIPEETYYEGKRRKYRPAESLGYMHTYTDIFGVKHRLWMYVGVLLVNNDVEKLLDVARRGDALARGRALCALADVGKEETGFLRILNVWLNAGEYGDTIDVSDMVLWDEKSFQVVKQFAGIALNILYPRPLVSEEISENEVPAGKPNKPKEKPDAKPMLKKPKKPSSPAIPKPLASTESKIKPAPKLPVPSKKKPQKKALKIPKPKRPN